MARKTSEKSVSLFPFLAVLVCTMGALILLLLLTTRRIQKEQHTQSQPADVEISMDVNDIEQSFGLTVDEDMPRTVADTMDSQAADSVAPQPSDLQPQLALGLPETDATNPFDFPVFDLTEPDVSESPAPTEFELKVEIDRLTAALDADRQKHADLLAQIAAAEQKLADSSVDSELQHHTEQLANLKQQESVLRAQLSAQQLALVDLKGQLDQTSKTTEEAERILRIRESALVSLRKLTEDATIFRTARAASTLLEFTNATGTSQRPIVVEVSNAGYRFLPSDVLVTADDMEGFPKNDNPLLSGVAALHQKLAAESAATSPYVLLLVRPDGSLPFYSAQRTLKDAGINFGYELVDQDKQVFVGNVAEDERLVLREAVESAISRKNEMYGGMLAEIQRLQQDRNQQPERQARLMPDGRITVPGEKDHGLSGRFFAGGELPEPRSSYADRSFTNQPAPPRPEQSRPEQSRPEQMMAAADEPGDIPNPFESVMTDAAKQSAASASQQLAATGDLTDDSKDGFPDTNIPNPFAMNDYSEERDSKEDPAAGSQDVLRIEDLFAGESNEAIQANPGPTQTPLSDSLMAGGFRDVGEPFSGESFNGEAFAGEPAAEESQLQASVIPQDGMQSAMAPNNSNLPERIDLNWLNQSLINNDKASTLEPGSSLPPDWSESVTAPADEASRTVDAAQNPLSPSTSGQPSASADLMATLRQNSNGPGGQPVFGEHEESALSKFMRSLDSEIEANRPDPFLVSMLESANATQADSQAEAVASPYLPVAITLKNSTLQVGRAAPISVAGMTDQQVLNATLERLAAEVEAQRSEGGSFPTPTIDFRIDGASVGLHSTLQKQLQNMQVPTRSTSVLSPPAAKPPAAKPPAAKPPAAKPIDNTETWPLFDATSPQRESATPMNSSPPVRSKGRLSI